MKREIDRFEVATEDGRRFSAVTIQDLRDARTMDGPSWIEGLPEYRLLDGRRLNQDGDAFRIVVTGELVRRL